MAAIANFVRSWCYGAQADASVGADRADAAASDIHRIDVAGRGAISRVDSHSSMDEVFSRCEEADSATSARAPVGTGPIGRSSLTLEHAPENHSLSLERADPAQGKPIFVIGRTGAIARYMVIQLNDKHAALDADNEEIIRSLDLNDDDESVDVDAINLLCKITNRDDITRTVYITSDTPGLGKFRRHIEEYKIGKTQYWPEYAKDGIGPTNGTEQLKKNAPPLQNMGSIKDFEREQLAKMLEGRSKDERIAILTRLEIFRQTYGFLDAQMGRLIKAHEDAKAGASADVVADHQAQIDRLNAIKQRLQNDVDQTAVCWAVTAQVDAAGHADQVVGQLQTALQGKLTPQPWRIKQFAHYLGFGRGPELSEADEKNRIQEYGLDVQRMVEVASRAQNEEFSKRLNRPIGKERLEHALFVRTAMDIQQGNKAPLSHHGDRFNIMEGALFAGMKQKEKEDLRRAMEQLDYNCQSLKTATDANVAGIADGETGAVSIDKYFKDRARLLAGKPNLDLAR